MDDAVATCDCCGASLKKPVGLGPFTLGERCAKKIVVLRRYLRDSSRFPEMYPRERAVARHTEREMLIADSLIAARRAA